MMEEVIENDLLANEEVVAENLIEEVIADEEVVDVNFENLMDVSSDDDSAVLSNDSDYDSDLSDLSDITDTVERSLSRVEINSLNEFVKVCSISFYYETENTTKFCEPCFFRIAGLFSRIRAVRVHETNTYPLILGRFCNECRNPLYQILPCNLCPICTH